jgi:hypothetical protein
MVYLPRVNSARRGFYLGGAFPVMPAPDIEGVAFNQKRTPNFPMEFQPSVAEGVSQGHEEARLAGKRLCSFRLEVDLLKYHDVDTSQEGARIRSRAFVLYDLWASASPVELASAWKTEASLDLARAYRATGERECLPVLADALEEAGCDLAFLLSHLRACPDHGEDCWVVEMLLGARDAHL